MDERLELIEQINRKYVMTTYERLPVAFVRGEGYDSGTLKAGNTSTWSAASGWPFSATVIPG